MPSLRGIRTTPALAAAAAAADAGAAAASPGAEAPAAAATPAPGAAGAAPLAPPQQQRAAGTGRECADDPPSSSLPQGAASSGSGAPQGAGGAELATPEPAAPGAATAAADVEATPPLAFSAGGFECDGQQGDTGMDCMDCMDGLDCMDGTDCMDCNDGMDGMRADGVNGISSGGDDDGGVAADCDLAHPSGAAAAPSARAHIDQECSEGLAVALAAAVGSAAGGSAGRETRLTRDVQAGCKVLCSSSGGRGRKRRAAESAGVAVKGATDAAADAPRKTRDQADGAAAGGCCRSTKRQTRSRAAGASGGAGEVAAGGSTKAARGGGDEAERRATRDQPGFPGSTPRQQAEADRAWAAGEEVAMRPQSVPKKTAEEHRREAHDKEFWVRCIKGHRLCRKTRKREFLVHWWYFSDAWNSWEPREMLSGPPGTYKWALPMPSAVARIKR
ncbi:hypothetical protein MNEG_7141 [Monoraphidium neglectum]|uniref:Chromo domain-containing protein n=1 Tax=Monoraphidium neglectum TaxID=145388 RepID=A0A0D2JNU3_9CHLO|nr:hypothetical protein MNEG_7141 [Monoraphidium neglectum]KIZ00818.1 hypothetical protein MNEG_7141 [Monoraphidium neglectum]|eukprot:XP_013899837.1 hypothetical protein MNEG_7141 [Monoraphidium neglectum]